MVDFVYWPEYYSPHQTSRKAVPLILLTLRKAGIGRMIAWDIGDNGTPILSTMLNLAVRSKHPASVRLLRWRYWDLYPRRIPLMEADNERGPERLLADGQFFSSHYKTGLSLSSALSEVE